MSSAGARPACRIRSAPMACSRVGIGLYCALTPVFFWLASRLYRPAARHADRLLREHSASCNSSSSSASCWCRPRSWAPRCRFSSRAWCGARADIARTVGMLYAVNTFGAVVGVALAGYVLLPAFGNRTVLWAAAASNVAIGLVAIRYGARSRRPAQELRAPAAARRRRAGPRRRLRASSVPAGWRRPGSSRSRWPSRAPSPWSTRSRGHGRSPS